jgi:hypothetical protein
MGVDPLPACSGRVFARNNRAYLATLEYGLARRVGFVIYDILAPDEP